MFKANSLRVPAPRLFAASIHGLRNYSGPLAKSYAALTSPISVFWAHKVPLSAKYASALITTALGATHIHPSTIITLGPPGLAAAYFLYRRFENLRYKNLLKLVKNTQYTEDGDNKTVLIHKYDPADGKNVMAGIENEFDSFRSQIMPIIRNRLVEYVTETDRNGTQSRVAQSLLDTNKQVGVHVDEDPETFVTLKAESEHEGVFPKFISFSVPYFTSRNVALRKRLGTLQVSMLEITGPENEALDLDSNVTEYRLAIQAWPYSMFSQPERIH